eukprot:g4720.t1
MDEHGRHSDFQLGPNNPVQNFNLRSFSLLSDLNLDMLGISYSKKNPEGTFVTSYHAHSFNRLCQWQQVFEKLNTIDNARSRDSDIDAEASPYPARESAAAPRSVTVRLSDAADSRRSSSTEKLRSNSVSSGNWPH